MLRSLIIVISVFITKCALADTLSKTQDELYDIGRRAIEAETNVSKLNANSEVPNVELSLESVPKPETSDFEGANQVATEAGANQTEQPTLYVFISLSMPENELLKILRDSQRFGSKVLVQGFYKGDLQATANRFKELLEKAGPAEIDIDPLKFKMYGIKRVPSYIATLEPSDRCVKLPCNIPRHAFAFGSVSLEYFLHLLRSEGKEMSQKVAGMFIERGEER